MTNKPKWHTVKDSTGKPMGWVTEECLKAERALEAQLHNDYWYRVTSKDGVEKFRARARLNEDNRKLAWIIVGKTRKIAWVDNKTMDVYKADGIIKTWMLWPRCIFERWMTSMDV